MCDCLNQSSVNNAGGDTSTVDTNQPTNNSGSSLFNGGTFLGKSLLFWLVVAILVISLLTYMEVGRG